MGLTLSLVEVESNDYHFVEGELFLSSKSNWNFVESNDLDTITVNERECSRPINIDQAIKWVVENEEEINYEEALNSLNKMKDNAKLYFYWDL